MPDVSMNGKNGNGKSMVCPCPVCQGGMNACGSCVGGSCGWRGHGFGWILVKIVIAVFILSAAFSFGVLVGEFKMALGGVGFDGRTMMRSYYGSPFGAYPMMGGAGYAVPESVPTSTR